MRSGGKKRKEKKEKKRKKRKGQKKKEKRKEEDRKGKEMIIKIKTDFPTQAKSRATGDKYRHKTSSDDKLFPTVNQNFDKQ